MKIYTKNGDKGMTSLFGGKRVKKNDVHISLVGALDELNVFVGAIKDHNIIKNDIVIYKTLEEIQKNIIRISAYIVTVRNKNCDLTILDIEKLEEEIDKIDKILPPLKEFILPGGEKISTSIHKARVFTRKAEREIVSFMEHEEIDDIILQYFNRLSDYFFILARYYNER